MSESVADNCRFDQGPCTAESGSINNDSYSHFKPPCLIMNGIIDVKSIKDITMNFLRVFGRVGFFGCLFVCLSVCLQDYLKYNEQICMKFLPESRAKDQIINFCDIYITVSDWLSGICYILRSGIFTSVKGGYVSGRVYLFVCLSTWYFLPGMYLYLGPRNNSVNCVDHPHYDPATHLKKIIVSRFKLFRIQD